VVLRGLERAQSDGVGNGTQTAYFELYRYTVEAIKGVDKMLKVGARRRGPTPGSTIS